MKYTRGWMHRNGIEPETGQQTREREDGAGDESWELCTPESRLWAAPGLVRSTGLGVFSGGGDCRLSGPRRRMLTGSCWARGLLGPG